MATWKKVIVSGSSAELSALKVDNLTQGEVVIGGGSAGNLSTTAINGTGNILATTGATGVSISGSFSGSFQGDGSNLTGIAATLAVSGSSGNGSVDLKTQALSIVGTANEVETSVSGQTVTIGLPNNVTIGGNLTVQNNLTVFGTASFQETTNLQVADRFVLLASGSNAGGDGGIVVQQATQDIGELFGFDSATTRWGVTSSFNASAPSYTPDAFMAAAVIGGTSINTPSSVAARYSAKGNLFIGDDESIWIYS